LSRVKSSGGAAYFLSGAELIACKDVGRFAAFSCPWPPSSTCYKLREIERSELLTHPLRLENGYLVVPEGPGLDIELSEVAIRKYPPVDKVLETPLGYDGSVQDR
jgi:hypothetical protein